MAGQGKLYLIPSTLGEENPLDYLPSATLDVIQSTTHFIVENEKSARKFLKACEIKTAQNDLIIYQLDKHDKRDDAAEFLENTYTGNSIGLLSEAGVPAVADPGNKIVIRAHELSITVVPLVGASSILMALMASGLNGQHFTFHGYLPIETNERKKAIREIEEDSKESGYTQIFIETPYRNNAIFKELLNTCNKHTKLSIATNLNQATEQCNYYRIGEWKKLTIDLNKKPSVFLLLA